MVYVFEVEFFDTFGRWFQMGGLPSPCPKVAFNSRK